MEKKIVSRRNFLKMVGMAAASAALAACTPTTTTKEPTKQPETTPPINPPEPSPTQAIFVAKATYTPLPEILSSEITPNIPGITIEKNETYIYKTSSDGKTKLLSFPDRNKTYVINSQNPNEIKIIERSGDQVFIKNDGNQIYFHKNTGNEDAIYDLQKEKDIKIIWPKENQLIKELQDPIRISDDFKVIARHTKMDEETRPENCKFGLLYLFQNESGSYDPYLIHSPQRPFVPEEIWQEDGIYYLRTTLGDIFRYKLDDEIKGPKFKVFHLYKFSEFQPQESIVEVYLGNELNQVYPYNK